MCSNAAMTSRRGNMKPPWRKSLAVCWSYNLGFSVILLGIWIICLEETSLICDLSPGKLPGSWGSVRWKPCRGYSLMCLGLQRRISTWQRSCRLLYSRHVLWDRIQNLYTILQTWGGYSTCSKNSSNAFKFKLCKTNEKPWITLPV